MNNYCQACKLKHFAKVCKECFAVKDVNYLVQLELFKDGNDNKEM
jgi:hypothetical protein